MIRSIKHFSVLFFAGIILLASCAKQLTEVEKEKLPRKKTGELVDVLDSLSDLKPNLFYTKISTKFSDTNRDVSFKTSVRLVKDSAINTLITYATLPVFNAMITRDSVVLVNKREKCYIRQSMDYIKENFAVDFNYKNIEEIILGLPLDFDSTQKYFQLNDPYNYIVSSHKKRELKKVEKLQKEDIAIRYYLSDDLRSLKGMYIESPSDTASIQIDYTERQSIGNYNLPREVFIQIRSPRNNMQINMTYEKVEVNEPKELILIIPESYAECEE